LEVMRCVLLCMLDVLDVLDLTRSVLLLETCGGRAQFRGFEISVAAVCSRPLSP